MKKLILIIFLSLFMFIGIQANAYGFGFKRNSSNETPDIGMYSQVIKGTDSYYVGDTTKKVIYLTMDAGYDNGNMSKILDILKEKNVQATFFLTGDFFKYSDLVNRMVIEGHIVGNHTMHHKNITKISNQMISEEITKVEELYKETTKKDMVKFFRPPEGEFDKESLMVVKELGYKTFFWSIAYSDWQTDKQKGGDYGYKMIMNNLHNGAIILMHSVSKDNVICLPKIIDDARSLGYEFRNLDTI